MSLLAQREFLEEDDETKLIAACPHLEVAMGGVQVPCLVDTGSMVSTITESFFHQYFEPWGQAKLQFCQWLMLRTASGLPIPYLGYLKLKVELCGQSLFGCVVLVI